MSAALMLAHAGHWLSGLLYLAPVLIVVAALVHQSWKDRRRGEDEAADDAPDVAVRDDRT
jgi:4-hydroxybenzoate polyprenyltransferase